MLNLLFYQRMSGNMRSNCVTYIYDVLNKKITGMISKNRIRLFITQILEFNATKFDPH